MVEILLVDPCKQRGVVAPIEEPARQYDLLLEQALRLEHDPDELIAVEQHILHRPQLLAGVPEHHLLTGVDLELTLRLIGELLEPVRHLRSRTQHARDILQLLTHRLGLLAIHDVRLESAHLGRAEVEVDPVVRDGLDRVFRSDELVGHEKRTGR